MNKDRTRAVLAAVLYGIGITWGNLIGNALWTVIPSILFACFFLAAVTRWTWARWLMVAVSLVGGVLNTVRATSDGWHVGPAVLLFAAAALAFMPARRGVLSDT